MTNRPRGQLSRASFLSRKFAHTAPVVRCEVRARAPEMCANCRLRTLAVRGAFAGYEAVADCYLAAGDLVVVDAFEE